MRSRSLFRLLPLLLLALGGAREAAAQACLSTQGSNEYCKALTAGVRFGFPRYTTAALPTCNTSNKGAVAFDTTAGSYKGCDGSTWAAIGFSGGTITSPILAPAADNCANVPYSFTGNTNTGMCSSGADTVWLKAGGNQVFRVTDSTVHAAYPMILASIYSPTYGTKLIFNAGAGRLSLIDDTNPNQFHWYHTDTGGNDTNYQRGTLKTSSTGIEIAAETAGSGADDLDVMLVPAGAGSVKIPATAGYPAFRITATGNTRVYAGTVAASNAGYVLLLDDTGQGTEVAPAYVRGSKTKTLTDAGAAVAVTRIAVATNSFMGGEAIWTATSTDGTDQRTLQGKIRFAGVDKGGTVTCAAPQVIGTDLEATTNGNHLTCTWSSATSTTNCDLLATCTDDTAGSQTITMNVRLDMPLPNTVTPQ